MVTVTTAIDEVFDQGTETDEANDGSGLSLAEAIGLITAGTSTGPINFSSSIGGSFIDITTRLSLTVDLLFDAVSTATTTADVVFSDSAALVHRPVW